MCLSQDQPEGLAEKMSDNPGQRSNAELTFYLWRIYLVDWYDKLLLNPHNDILVKVFSKNLTMSLLKLFVGDQIISF